MAAAAIVVVPVRLHKKQSQIPARINQNNIHKEPNFSTKLFGRMLYAKKNT
jgi:hypothetical protein